MLTMLLAQIALANQNVNLNEFRMCVMDGSLLVESRIGKETGWFIVDSGAFCSCISAELANRLGPLNHVGGPARKREGLDFVEAPPIAIGGIRLNRRVVSVERNLQFTPSPDGGKILGCLGFDCLRLLRIQLDFRTSRGWVAGPLGNMVLPRNFAPIARLSVDSRSIPLLQCQIGGVPITAVFDTGCTVASINPTTLSRCGSHASLGKSFRFGTYEGSREMIGGLTDIRVGDMRWSRMEFSVCRPNDPECFPLACLQALGTVVLDFAHGTIYANQDRKQYDLEDICLGQFGWRKEQGVLLGPSGQQIPATNVIEAWGVTDFYRLPIKHHYSEQEIKQLGVAYTADSQARTRNIKTRSKVYQLSVSKPRPRRSRCAEIVCPIEQPGYYAQFGDHVVLLSQGELWFPVGLGSVLSIGGIRPAQFLRASAGYEHWEVPESPERYEQVWRYLGWKRQPTLLWIDGGGLAHSLRDSARVGLSPTGFTIVPKGCYKQDGAWLLKCR